MLPITTREDNERAWYELIQAQRESDTIDSLIKELQEGLETMATDSRYSKYSYVTFEDILKMNSNSMRPEVVEASSE